MATGTPNRKPGGVSTASPMIFMADAAGAAGIGTKPVTDRFYGDFYGDFHGDFYDDRAGAATDPWGGAWRIATKIEDLDDATLQERAPAFQADMAGESNLRRDRRRQFALILWNRSSFLCLGRVTPNTG